MITLVRYLLKDQLQLQREDANSDLMKTIADSANYDDAVREEIGRILLEWNQHAPPKLGGGSTSTRKRKLVCRLNARTRRQSKTRTGKYRNTRKKCKANKRKIIRSRRA